MTYKGCLLAVKDIVASKNFYEKVLHQNEEDAYELGTVDRLLQNK